MSFGSISEETAGSVSRRRRAGSAQLLPTLGLALLLVALAGCGAASQGPAQAAEPEAEYVQAPEETAEHEPMGEESMTDEDQAGPGWTIEDGVLKPMEGYEIRESGEGVTVEPSVKERAAIAIDGSSGSLGATAYCVCKETGQTGGCAVGSVGDGYHCIKGRGSCKMCMWVLQGSGFTPTSGSTADTDAHSTLEPGMDRAGKDYRAFWLAEPNPQVCMDTCRSESRCAAWTYVKPGIQGSKARCWLKNSVPTVRANGCCTSGVKYTLEPGKDRPGRDYKNFWMRTPDPQLCLNSCLNRDRCRAWTYVKPGVQGTYARCWLKDSVPGPRLGSCCTSGVKGAGG